MSKKRDLYNMSEFSDEYSGAGEEDMNPDYDDEEIFDEYSRAGYPGEYDDEEEDYPEDINQVPRMRRGGGGGAVAEYDDPSYYLTDPAFQRYLLKNGLISYDDSESDFSDSGSEYSSEEEEKISKRKKKTKTKKQAKKKTTKKKGKK